jgi:hypothetical protein
MKRDGMRLFTVFSLVAGLLLLQACGDDDPASPGADNPPDMPLLQGVEIDSGYFQQNNPADQDVQENPEAYAPYLTAQQIVLGMDNVISDAVELPRFFLTVSNQREPEFVDGTWIWQFPFTVDGSLIDEEEDFTVDVYITADVDEVSNRVNWEFLFSGTGTPFGDIENFRLFEIMTNLDNTSGDLQFYSPENPNVPLLDVSWDIAAADEKTISVTMITEVEEGDNDNGNGDIITLAIDYSENGDEFSLVFNDGSQETPVDVNWNTGSLDGSITDPMQTCFWGSDLAVTECN